MVKKLRVSEVARQLNVSSHSVRKYVNDGKLACSLTPSGQRVFSQDQVDVFLGIVKDDNKIIAFYARSSNGNKVLIENQFSALGEIYGVPFVRVSDNSSGLNDKRAGLWKLVKLAKNKEITHVAITQEDRLTRFGYHFLVELFREHNVEVLVLGIKEEKSLQEELMHDFMNLIASFSGKFYRLRGYEQQKMLLEKAKDHIDEKQ